MTTSNQAQRDAWNGDSGLRWVADPDSRDRAMVDVATALLDAAHLQPGEAVLDIGCGCGTTTFEAADAVGPTGSVLGVDISEPMLTTAHHRLTASQLSNVAFLLADAQTDQLPVGEHDIVISRFGTMFFDDPAAAFTNIAGSLLPGGRLCIATWQPLLANDWLLVPGAALLAYGSLPTPGNEPGMFGQSDPELITDTLTAAGFHEIDITAANVPMYLGVDADAATSYLMDTGIAHAVLDTIDPADRNQAVADATAVLAQHADPDGVVLSAGILITTADRLR